MILVSVFLDIAFHPGQKGKEKKNNLLRTMALQETKIPKIDQKITNSKKRERAQAGNSGLRR
jgi:hypothetical protein